MFQRYFVINPATFGLGDIVEISVAFVCIPIINGYKLMTTLRGMVLLDNSVRKVGTCYELTTVLIRCNRKR
jgi:uncharacterized phage infection (PIP) family protein YhgE